MLTSLLRQWAAMASVTSPVPVTVIHHPSPLHNAYVLTGIIGAVLAIAFGIGKLVEALWNAAFALVHFSDTVKSQRSVPAELASFREEFKKHASDDLSFQRWIIRKLDIDATPEEMTK